MLFRSNDVPSTGLFHKAVSIRIIIFKTLCIASQGGTNPVLITVSDLDRRPSNALRMMRRGSRLNPQIGRASCRERV